MCHSNTNSRMAVVSTKTSQRPLNPYAAPFISSTASATCVATPPQPHGPYTPLFPLTPVAAIYPHLLCAAAVIHHPHLKYPTKTKPNSAKHKSVSFKIDHPKKLGGGHSRFTKFRNGRLFEPPRLKIPVPAPEKVVRRTMVVREAPVPEPEKIEDRKKLVSVVAEPMECKKTSVMMKNIPNQYRRDDLMEFIDKFCLENQMQYDFLYLPMDFKRHNNKGYAFINFTKPNDARVFQDLMNGYKWGWVNLRNSSIKSTKICEITWAKIQGKNGLVKHFKNSNFPCHTKKYLPVELSPPSSGSSSTTTLTIVGRCLRFK